MTETRLFRVLEVIAIALASVVLSVGLIITLSGYFANRDQAGVSGTSDGPGLAYPDLGDATLQPGELRPAYNSEPPTSGAHIPEPVRQDGAELDDNQILTVLAAGDVVLLYGGRKPPPGLASLARSIEPFTPALAQAGQAVILARRPGTDGVLGLAWTRIVSVSGANDPLLRQFAQYWLGRGAHAH
jgi:uncharacterized protein DUF3105